jgi:hypothetical protein
MGQVNRFILVTLFLLSGVAHAQNVSHCEAMQPPPGGMPLLPVTGDFKVEARAIISRLLDKGYRAFGELDLNAFARDMDIVQIAYVPYLRYYDNGRERASACWKIADGRRSIDVSQWMWGYTDADNRPIIALHEFLGAARFNDRDYQVSSAMALLSLEQTNGYLEPEQIPTLQNLKHVIVEARSGGGIVGVGGGGDWVGVIFKLQAYRHALEQLRKARTPEEHKRALEEVRDAASGSGQWQIDVKWR